MDYKRTYDEIYTYIKDNLNLKRFKHSLAVECEAIKLGKIYGENIENCSLAGICHDCLKNVSDEGLFELISKYNIKLDQIQLKSPQILHGPVGAEFCRKHFGIEDIDILNAVKYHTTGRNGMSMLEKIIYISDIIEEGRDFPGIDEIRSKAYSNLDEALFIACNQTIIYVINKNELLHPLTVDLRNSLIMKGGVNVG